MDRATEITRNSISHIYQTSDTSSHPIVQICDLKKISQPSTNPNAPPRYRLAISDGEHYQQAMLATQLNSLVDERKISLNCLVRLVDFIVNNLQKKRILIILSIDFIAELPAMAGHPISIDTAMAELPRQTENPANVTNENAKPNVRVVESEKDFGLSKVHGTFSSTPTTSWHGPTGATTNLYTSDPSGMGIMTKINSTPSSVYRPIQRINPYQNGWIIRGKCTYKSELRKFQNHRGEGQVISFELSDDSGSIRITGFTQHAPIIEQTVHVGRVYKVSRASLKQANANFNKSTSSFEMTLDKNSLLEEVPDDGTCKIKYTFIKINNLHSIDLKGLCDVVGVVTSIGPLTEVVIRSTGEPCPKRSIHITDDSNASVELTLWRKQAETFLTEADLERHPVILVRNASRGDFGRVCLNVMRMTSLELDPVNIPEANKLRAWYDSGGCNEDAVQPMSAGPGGASGKITGPRRSLAVAKEEVVDPVFGSGGSPGATAMFVTRAYVGFVNSKNDLYYPGDPETKKKLTENGPGLWFSESTGQQLTDEQVVWRYIVSMKVMDHSSSHWVSAFDEVGQVLFGRTAKEFRALKGQDPALAEHLIEDATFRPMLMKMTVKERTWKDEQQIRYTIARSEHVDYATEGHVLLNEIASYGVM